jgi:hypothetical protein
MSEGDSLWLFGDAGTRQDHRNEGFRGSRLCD